MLNSAKQNTKVSIGVNRKFYNKIMYFTTQLLFNLGKIQNL